MIKRIFLITFLTLMSTLALADQPFSQLVKFTVKPSHLQAFKLAATNSAYLSREEPGNIEMRLFSDTSNVNVIYVYSRWKNQASYVDHINQPYTQDLARIAKNSLAEEPEITTLSQINSNDNISLNDSVLPVKHVVSFAILSLKNSCDKTTKQHVKKLFTELENTHRALNFDFYKDEANNRNFMIYPFTNIRHQQSIRLSIALKHIYSDIRGELSQLGIIDNSALQIKYVTEIII